MKKKLKKLESEEEERKAKSTKRQVTSKEFDKMKQDLSNLKAELEESKAQNEALAGKNQKLTLQYQEEQLKHKEHVDFAATDQKKLKAELRDALTLSRKQQEFYKRQTENWQATMRGETSSSKSRASLHSVYGKDTKDEKYAIFNKKDSQAGKSTKRSTTRKRILKTLTTKPWRRHN